MKWRPFSAYFQEPTLKTAYPKAKYRCFLIESPNLSASAARGTAYTPARRKSHWAVLLYPMRPRRPTFDLASKRAFRDVARSPVLEDYTPQQSFCAPKAALGLGLSALVWSPKCCLLDRWQCRCQSDEFRSVGLLVFPFIRMCPHS